MTGGVLLRGVIMGRILVSAKPGGGGRPEDLRERTRSARINTGNDSEIAS